MALSPRLEMRQGQSLVMTPQLQQAIKLLQLSNLELADYVANELERNPLLEADEGQMDRDLAERIGEDGNAGERNGDKVNGVESDLKLDESAPAASAEDVLDTDYDNVYSEDTASDAAIPQQTGSDWSQVRSSGGSFDSGEFSLEATLTKEMTLPEHLTEQMQMTIWDPALRLIGAHLIDQVDEAGYFTGDCESVAERMGTDTETVETVLKTLQTFEPSGVMARSLKECLAIQCRERDRLDPAMQALIDNLELLAKRDIDGLVKVCGVDREDVLDMVEELRQLDPKPGRIFDTAPVQTVVPDVFVRPAPDGGWTVELNSETLPRVLVNNIYYSQVSKRSASKDDKAYLTECLQNANWLVKSLDQRARTILKVASEIVRQQDAFLAHGVAHLRPLNLRIIAEAISMHESTVSRVTANKYIATPRGLFEMKYFFTSAIASTEGGEAHSAESVRHKIKALIDDEAPNAVLSDDRIVELLKEAGIDIARRTVAKYREAMRIPSSVQRRRMKRAMA